MIQKTKKQKKGSISEENISTVLQRYSVTTVLALLQEVTHCADVKIDWNALVKKTSTGISNPREYQMLWRHLAYREALLDTLDDEAHPLDNDSDLEFELEAVPATNNEASTEATACVKVLIASGLPSDNNMPNGATVEAPLTINIPNGQSIKALENSQPTSSMQGTNITIPVTVPKLPHPAKAVAKAPDANGATSCSILPRRKRKPWSEAEDLELLAAVQKFGEGNWANILKGEFKGDRTASQLSQRWATIKKQYGNLDLGSNTTGPQLSEAQLAARHAMSLALDMPVKSLAANSVGTATASGTTTITATNASKNSNLPITATEASTQNQSKQSIIPTKPFSLGSLGAGQKSQIVSKNPPIKSTFTFGDNLRAAAVAAGARIASPSDAASLLKAAKAKNAVHIRAGSSIKSTMHSGIPTHSEAHPDVHYNGTSLAATSGSSHSTVSYSVTPSVSLKAISLPAQHARTNTILVKRSYKQTNDVNQILDQKPSKKGANTKKCKTVSQTGDTAKEQVQANVRCISQSVHNELVFEAKASLQAPQDLFKNPENPVSSPNMKKVECDQAVAEIQANGQNENKNVISGSPIRAENQAIVGSYDNQSTNEVHKALPRVEAAGCGEKMEIFSTDGAGINNQETE